MAQAEPAPRKRSSKAAAGRSDNGSQAAAPRTAAAGRATRPAARARSPPCASSRPASSAARTTGRGSPSSARSSTSACSRSSRATRSRDSSTRSSGCSRRSRTTRAASDGAAGFITRLREGTWAGHVAEHIALEFQNLAGTDVRHGKTRGTGEYGRYNVIFEYREEQVGIEAGKMAVGLVNHLVAPDGPGPRVRPHGGAGDAHPPRRAARLRPVHPGAPRRGRGSRHPVHPPRPVQPRPAGPGRPPAADPRDDDQPHGRDRRRHRVRQEAHQPPARLGRPPRAAVRGRRDRGRRRRRRAPAGLPVRHQAARRQPRPRRRARPAQRRRRPCRVARVATARAAARTSSSSRTSRATTTAA